MSPRARANLAYAIVVVGALTFIAYRFGLFETVATEFPVAGEVQSVDSDGGEDGRVASVKLPSGEVVRAAVPSACLVLPGQTATIYYSGVRFWTSPKYTVMKSE